VPVVQAGCRGREARFPNRSLTLPDSFSTAQATKGTKSNERPKDVKGEKRIQFIFVPFVSMVFVVREPLCGR
jgi:hypothetical protein